MYESYPLDFVALAVLRSRISRMFVESLAGLDFVCKGELPKALGSIFGTVSGTMPGTVHQFIAIENFATVSVTNRIHPIGTLWAFVTRQVLAIVFAPHHFLVLVIILAVFI